MRTLWSQCTMNLKWAKLDGKGLQCSHEGTRTLFKFPKNLAKSCTVEICWLFQRRTRRNIHKNSSMSPAYSLSCWTQFHSSAAPYFSRRYIDSWGCAGYSTEGMSRGYGKGDTQQSRGIRNFGPHQHNRWSDTTANHVSILSSTLRRTCQFTWRR